MTSSEDLKEFSFQSSSTPMFGLGINPIVKDSIRKDREDFEPDGLESVKKSLFDFDMSDWAILNL